MTVYLYEKDPEQLIAVQLTKENASDLAKWCGGRIVEESDALSPQKKYVGINVPIFDGPKRLSEGDYLARNRDGQFSVWAERSFTKIYHLSSGAAAIDSLD